MMISEVPEKFCASCCAAWFKKKKKCARAELPELTRSHGRCMWSEDEMKQATFRKQLSKKKGRK